MEIMDFGESTFPRVCAGCKHLRKDTREPVAWCDLQPSIQFWNPLDMMFFACEHRAWRADLEGLLIGDVRDILRAEVNDLTNALNRGIGWNNTNEEDESNG